MSTYSNATSLPTHLLQPGGMMEEVINHINSTARRKQSTFSVSASIALMGTALGRRYKSYTGVYPNIYCINIGPTGCGKDHPRKVIKKILHEAGVSEHLGGDRVTSAAAIVAKLNEQPNTLYLLDEIGDWLKSISSSGSSQFTKEINATLLTLFTSSDSVYGGTDYADRSANKSTPINHPSLSLLGTTTSERLIEGLRLEDASSGLLGRFLCFETLSFRPSLDTRKISNALPTSIIDWVRLAMDATVTTEVNCTTTAEKILYSLVKKDEVVALSDASSITKNLWVRAFELASKISLIVACGKNIKNPIVDVAEAQYAVDLVTWCIEENCKRINENVAENEIDKQLKRLTTFIRNVKKSKNQRYLLFTSKGYAPKSYLMNVMKLHKKPFQEVIDTALGSDLIEMHIHKNANNEVEYFVLKP
jgi:hypothetical protein